MDKYIVNITLLGSRERLPRRHLLLGTAGEACFVHSPWIGVYSDSEKGESSHK